MYDMLLPVFFPIVAGIFLLIRKEMKERKNLLVFAATAFLLEAMLVILALCMQGGETVTLFYLTEKFPILFCIDEMSILFSVMTVIIFLCAGFFSFEYMKHEEKEKRYYGFYLIVWGVLIALCFAGNLITFYLFFEMLTLTSMPLVLHNRTREAVMAGLKYLFYSLAGAYMALFGLYFMEKYGSTLTFQAGGVLDGQAVSAHSGLLLVVAMLMLVGFGVKAGMFPMHAWLTAAHPAAPAPASAVLSAVIVKAGVLGIVRVVYYLFGTSFLRGTWVQTAWLVLTLITIFMGSMLAYRESVLKKRLAYSTISQVSYILFGLAVMDTDSVAGSLIHVLSHGFVKAALFLCAGAVIYMTGKTKVGELRGIGREMPVLIWCYTIVSLGLIGIPPTGGFVSKWYLAAGSLQSGLAGFSWIGPIVLLVSALLTAGYLLPISVNGFLPGAEYREDAFFRKKVSPLMTFPIVVLTILSVWIGLFPNPLLRFLENVIGRMV